MNKLTNYITKSLPKKARAKAGMINSELVISVEAEAIVDTLKFLRDDPKCLFKQLTDLTCVDYPERVERFEVVYILLGLKHNQRIKVKLQVDEATEVPSVHKIFSSAVWYEREVFDMYGVHFTGNPDLRRILTDYGFDGHPQRKDFPLTGYKELRYDEDKQRVVYEPVRLDQEFRNFDFLSPWEGTNYVLPGDEKANIEKPKVVKKKKIS